MADGTLPEFPRGRSVPGRYLSRPAGPRALHPEAAAGTAQTRRAADVFPDEAGESAPAARALAHLGLVRRTPAVASAPERARAAALPDTAADTATGELTGLAPGALVETADGRVPVEELAPGDRVITRDRGLQPLRWVGSCGLAAEALAFRPQMAPVRIARGALGGGVPERDLVLAPGHRLMLRTGSARAAIGAAEVLVAAGDLVGLPGIGRIAPACGGGGPAHVLQLMCDGDDGMLLRVEGLWCQSFRPDRARLAGLSPEDRAALAAARGAAPAGGGVLSGPGLRRPELHGAAARHLLEG